MEIKKNIGKVVVASLIVALIFPFFSISIGLNEKGVVDSWFSAFSFPGFWSNYIKVFVWYFWSSFLAIFIFLLLSRNDENT